MKLILVAVFAFIAVQLCSADVTHPEGVGVSFTDPPPVKITVGVARDSYPPPVEITGGVDRTPDGVTHPEGYGVSFTDPPDAKH